MSIKSRVIAAVAITAVGVGLASPAFAQTFTAGYGTGNVMPAYYDQNGVLHAGNAGQQSVEPAARRSGLNAFASIPGYASAQSQSLTGGGSAGYDALTSEEW
jgi:hypothetical protein